MFLCNAVINLQAQGWGQTQKIVPSDRFQGQFFGYSVAMDGDYAVVGMNNNVTNDEAGAYVFKNDGTGNWVEIQKLGNPNYHQFDSPGYSVAISGDYIFVGDRLEDYDTSENNFISAAGAVYVFKNDGNDNWNYIQKIVASDRDTVNQFGWSVSVSGDYAIIGAGIQDYDESGTNYIERAGAAYIFELDGTGTWNEVQKIVAPVRNDFDYFGRSVAISGNYAVVGAFQEDEDVSEGDTISSAGSAYIFERDTNGTWSEIQKIVASDREQGAYFGWSIALDGDHLVVGSNQDNEFRGAVYVFEKGGNDIWNQVEKLTASNSLNGDQFGYDLDIDGNRIIIGARYRDIGSPGDDGAAYIFEKQSGNWEETAFIYDMFNQTSEYFGYAVAISGDFALAGAYQDGEDENEENDLGASGAAFIFDVNEPNTLSVVENDFKSTIKSFPNPNQGNFTINLGNTYKQITYSVTNSLGQEIQKHEVQSSNKLVLNISTDSGIYFVNVSTDEGKSTVLKIIKQ